MLEFQLFLSVFLQVLLILYVGVKLAVVRNKALKNGEAKLKDIAFNNTAWPDYAKKAQNSLSNQFEMPMLFILAVLFIVQQNLADLVFVALAHIFVISRWIHMFIHTGSNNLYHRAGAYLVGLIAVFGIWFYLAWQYFSRIYL
ncbi:MAG: MAPEG family protein [Pseudomonadota bacterium]